MKRWTQTREITSLTLGVPPLRLPAHLALPQHETANQPGRVDSIVIFIDHSESEQFRFRAATKGSGAFCLHQPPDSDPAAGQAAVKRQSKTSAPHLMELGCLFS